MRCLKRTQEYFSSFPKHCKVTTEVIGLIMILITELSLEGNISGNICTTITFVPHNCQAMMTSNKIKSNYHPLTLSSLALSPLNPSLSISWREGYHWPETEHELPCTQCSYKSRSEARNRIVTNSPPDSPNPVHHLKTQVWWNTIHVPDKCILNNTEEARHHTCLRHPIHNHSITVTQ